MRYFIEFSYNGKNYHGWQLQPKAITVQGVLQNALTTILREEISVIGAGRTDSGVHALQMFAHFDTERELSDDLVRKLNAFLPYDIAVHSIRAVKTDAHARFDALKRTYQYHISIEKSPFRYDYSMPLTLSLNVDVMNEAAQILFDYTDFQCFSKTHTDVKTFNCKIYEAHWAIVGSELVFTITADRFLRNMVRAIVGTLINVGLQKLSLTGFEDIIISKSRSKAGASVPACGLFLTQVIYPEEIFLQKSN
ncbi:tRNA pseudouridine(38-40) synthase TruA [Capnocytophaga leadbetteri]|uniref:tRNA pseudouridine(38-40) synthase TruA n=1 Tax=Capnocytophaga leadbetteri TaxID=327575 RepID=UPI0026EFA55E|nr:tRNA pseudouridine(38-40) synthase TruA [Capnocytophaga leadbetteri]